MSTHIDDLRRRLFDAIDGVVAGTISVEQARQVSDLSQVIVNSAKIEVDYLRVTDGSKSAFIDPDQGRPARRPALSKDPLNEALRGQLGRDE